MNKMQFLLNPKDVYASNYLLFLIMRYFYIYPVKISFDDDSKYKLTFDRQRLKIPCLIMLFVTIGVLIQSQEISSLKGEFNALNIYASIQCVAIFFSTCLSYIFGFFAVKKFENFFNDILILDQCFNDSECCALWKTPKFINIPVFILVLTSYIYSIYSIFFLEKSLSFSVCFAYFYTVVSLNNIFLTIYCHICIAFLLKQRFHLVIRNLKNLLLILTFESQINLNTSEYSSIMVKQIFTNLEMISNICDIVEKINHDFGVIISSSIAGAIVWIVLLVFLSTEFYGRISKLFYYKILHYGLLINVIFVVFLLIYICNQIHLKVNMKNCYIRN